MNSTAIRRRFTDFFVERNHRLVPSSPLIPNDPTLLLANAGMNQFKPYFLGEVEPDYRRATSVQKCTRTSDIENVGDRSHCTFFEMLGNFSFGDYFKEGAIAYAWELVTEGYGLEPDRLWVTVYLDDDEAVGHWRDIGVPAERIQRLGKEDNYWDMGVPGPCGPCSEIHYDRGPSFGPGGGPASESDRYLEFWNLVFMQNIRGEGEGKDYPIIGELPEKNIDTGMGLERIAMVLQDADSMYETDLLAPVIHETQELSGAGYGKDDRGDRSLRIVTEHGRSASFLIADGVLPSNEGRGYILRRLLRRSVRHLRLLGVEDPALARVCQPVVASEEESFSRTLRQGSTLLEGAIRRTRDQGGARLAGDTAFQLHDTYGFPYELTLEAAAEAGLDVDADRFQELMDDQRRRAKEARRELDTDLRRLESYRDLSSRHGRTTFVGYETTTAEGRILGLLADGEELAEAGEGDQVELILDRTPFYAEGGGQVGDTGLVRTGGGAVLQVTDTRPGLEGFSVHSARVGSGEVLVDDRVYAEVDTDRREAVTRSHTATHTLHWALRDQLGEHARQQGSLVDAGRLRFDFAHFQAVPAERLAEIEAAVNRQLLADPDVRVWHGSLAEAEAAGALSLFGEKYGSVVRVVEVGDFSRELCGGTHVGHGSQVGPVHVLGEASIGANLRRIEALTGLEALHYVDRERQLLAEVAALLKTRPEDAPEQLRRRLEALANAQRELERRRVAGLERLATELAGRVAKEADGWLVVERVPEAGGDDLRRIASAVRDRVGAGPGVVVLGSEAQGKAAMVALLTADLAGSGAAARDVLARAAKAVGGGAGGKGDLASAGGRDPSRLDEALGIARADALSLLTGGDGGSGGLKASPPEDRGSGGRKARPPEDRGAVG